MENKDDETKSKADELASQIKDATKELEDLQDNCSHKEIDIRPTGENGKDIRRVCITCKRIVGYPTKQDLDDYMNK